MLRGGSFIGRFFGQSTGDLDRARAYIYGFGVICFGSYYGFWRWMVVGHVERILQILLAKQWTDGVLTSTNDMISRNSS